MLSAVEQASEWATLWSKMLLKGFRTSCSTCHLMALSWKLQEGNPKMAARAGKWLYQEALRDDDFHDSHRKNTKA